MIIAALVVFGALLVAWLVAPAEPPARGKAPVALDETLAEAA
jgi:hypothetical protein